MVVISRAVPRVLLGFIISNISHPAIDQAIADFKLGAFDAYDPIVKVSLNRTRFIGSTPEQVRDQLDAEGIHESFVLLDAETAESRSVWWVDRYLDEEKPSIPSTDYWENDWQYDQRQQYVVDVASEERVLLKVRFATVEIPIFRIQGSLSSTTSDALYFLETALGYSPDPSRPQKPYTKYDWERNPPSPPPAYVIATPDEYETSTDARQKETFVAGIWPPREVVRLKEELAIEHGLQSVWTHARGKGEGRIAFYQNWAASKGP